MNFHNAEKLYENRMIVASGMITIQMNLFQNLTENLVQIDYLLIAFGLVVKR